MKPTDNSKYIYGAGGSNSGNPYQRVGAVRLMFPGIADPEKQLNQAVSLSAVVQEGLEEYGIDRLEMLSYGGDSQQEFYFVAYSDEYVSPDAHSGVGQTASDEGDDAESAGDIDSQPTDGSTTKPITAYTDGGDSSGSTDDPAQPADTSDSQHTDAVVEATRDDTDIDTAGGRETDTPDEEIVGSDTQSRDTRAERLQNIIEEAVGETIGTQICNLDLSPLGVMPVPTCRLLQPKNISFDPSENTSDNLTNDLLTDLNGDRIPHVLQILTEPAANSKPHDYLITARLAVLGVGHSVVTDSDQQSFLRGDNQYGFSQYAPGPASDNWSMPVGPHKRFANAQSSYPSPLEKYSTLRLTDGSVEDLAVGIPEYSAMCAGRVHNDHRYEDLWGAYGRIPVTTQDLHHFFTIEPEYFDVSSFGQLVGASEPLCFTEQLGKQADGTAHSYGSQHPDQTTDPEDHSKEESKPHRELTNKRIRYLVRQGYEIIAVDQDKIDIELPSDPTTNSYLSGESRSDIVCEKSQIRFQEVEVENESKPAALLTNLARAFYHGHPVDVIAETRSEAKAKLWDRQSDEQTGPISMPFKRTDSGGTILYTLSTSVSRDDGDCVYLLPRESTEATWRLRPDDVLELVDADGSVLASGDAETSVVNFEYNTPRVYKDGSEWVLESASGEELRRRSTKAAAARGYTTIRRPFVPTRYVYLEQTTVEYQSGDGFTRFDKSPLWEQPHQNDSIRYEEAAKAFIELVTVESEGAEIPIPELRRRFKPWYNAQTDLKEPNETWFGRALRTYFEVDASDDHNKKLVGRTWRFTEGLVSPDLPFVDGDDDEENGTEDT